MQNYLKLDSDKFNTISTQHLNKPRILAWLSRTKINNCAFIRSISKVYSLGYTIFLSIVLALKFPQQSPSEDLHAETKYFIDLQW